MTICMRKCIYYIDFQNSFHNIYKELMNDVRIAVLYLLLLYLCLFLLLWYILWWWYLIERLVKARHLIGEALCQGGPWLTGIMSHAQEAQRKPVAHMRAKVSCCACIFHFTPPSMETFCTVASLLPYGAEELAGSPIHTKVRDGTMAAWEGAVDCFRKETRPFVTFLGRFPKTLKSTLRSVSLFNFLIHQHILSRSVNSLSHFHLWCVAIGIIGVALKMYWASWNWTSESENGLS